MSPGMLKMYISFVAMALMFVSVIAAIFGREKLKGFWKNLVLTISFICMVISGLIVFLVVFSGPIEG
ncbi:DUF2768 domain-containing protein [Anaerobacillus sp. MEB173]|uniref:DUF2768 domain-containing protein n=1 Tax=Anaerobacillus sp. MEB173 TaxID=3383345 RepID=UPI003F93F007